MASIRYEGLYEFARQHRLDFNELCRVVHAASGVPASADAGASPAELQAAFRAGWKVAAQWAKREDLMADISSPAYLKDMANALAPMLFDGTNQPSD